ncbi:MAG: hypothetical protein ACR2F6_16675 [Mycobacteriales bacterium]
MSAAIPGPLRAAAGLAAVAIDEVKRLPDRLVALPVTAVSTALQTSLKAQSHYADLVERGDALLSGLRGDQDDADPGAPQPRHNAASAGPGVDPADDARPEDGVPQPAWARFDEDEATGTADEPPVAGYDAMSLASLRARLRSLPTSTLTRLLAYEKTHAARPAFVTMLQNRIDTVTS